MRSSQELFRKEIVLRATADGPELYLAFGMSGDYAELLRRAVSK